MTPDDINRVVEEIERRWRERTPPTRPDEVLASYRVGRGEIRRWCNEQNIKLDELDPEFQAASLRMFARLQREFPDQKWDGHNAATKELAKAYGIVLPRIKKQ